MLRRVWRVFSRLLASSRLPRRGVDEPSCARASEVDTRTMRKWRRTSSASILSVLIFGGARFVAAFNRRAQHVSRKAGAFDAGWELAHTGKYFQSVHVDLFGFGVEVAFSIRKSLRVQLIRLQDNFFVG